MPLKKWRVSPDISGRMGEFHIKRIVLPSGKTVEIVYYQASGGGEPVISDVHEIARGMGLDERIGPKFLQAGVGFGGSCLVGEETVLVRRQGRIWMWRLDEGIRWRKARRSSTAGGRVGPPLRGSASPS